MNDKLQIFTDKIKAAKSIAIIGHKNPDGDALGSALALGRLIELNFGISPVCTYDGNIPETLGDVPLRSRMRYFGHLNITHPFDVVMRRWVRYALMMRRRMQPRFLCMK